MATDRAMALAAAGVAILQGISMATRPIAEGRAPLSVTLGTVAVLIAHALVYAVGPFLRRVGGPGLLLAIQSVLLVMLGALHLPLLVLVVLYAAFTACAVALLRDRMSSWTVFLATVVVIAIAAGISSGLYRGAIVAAIILVTGLAVQSVLWLWRGTLPRAK